MDNDAFPDDDRAVELSSIEAIYPELILEPSKPYHARLDIPVTPSTPLKIRFKQSTADAVAPNLSPSKAESTLSHVEENGNDIATSQSSNEQSEVHSLTHLPPLVLTIDLPTGYPTEEAPNVSLSVNPAWLPESLLDKLINEAEKLWEDNGRMMVIFDYISHLEEQALAGFGFADGENKGLDISSNLKIELLDYDINEKRRQFEKGTYDCGICLEPKKGTACHRLMQCGHVFCVSCLQDFFNSCITEGDVDNVKCLNPECGKKAAATGQPSKRPRHERTLNPSELLQIPLEQDIVQRYVHLKRKKALESDKNTVYCPRQWCQGAAKSKKHPKPEDMFDDTTQGSDGEDADGDEETHAGLPPMSERLSICEDCNYAFCSVCKKGWHGELAYCYPRKQAEPTEEELATEKYFRMHTTPCPTCSAPSQKSHGCNHMICFKCRTHFCYLCSSYLMPDNPYAHFNNPKSPCHMRLWELEGGDGEGQAVGQEHGGEMRHGLQDMIDELADGEEDFDSDSEDEEFIVEPRAIFGHNAPPPAPVPPRRARDRDHQVPPAAE